MTKATTMTAQPLTQEFIRSLYPAKADADKMAGMIASLQKLVQQAKDEPALSFLPTMADEVLTDEEFRFIMDLDEMQVNSNPLVMRRVNKNWGRLDQRRLRELITLLGNRT